MEAWAVDSKLMRLLKQLYEREREKRVNYQSLFLNSFQQVHLLQEQCRYYLVCETWQAIKLLNYFTEKKITRAALTTRFCARICFHVRECVSVLLSVCLERRERVCVFRTQRRTVTKYIYLSIVLKYTFWVSVLYLSIIFSGNLWL